MNDQTLIKDVVVPKGQRLFVSLPTVTAFLFGVEAIEVGQRHVWVRCGGQRRRIQRSVLNGVRFSDVALPARAAAFPELS